MGDSKTNGKLDLSQYSSAESAAKALADFLEDTFDANLDLYDPAETAERRAVPESSNAWCVSWEEGPYEWAVHLTGGESIFAGTQSQFSEPEVTGFYETDSWIAEPNYSFDLIFTDNR